MQVRKLAKNLANFFPYFVLTPEQKVRNFSICMMKVRSQLYSSVYRVS